MFISIMAWPKVIRNMKCLLYLSRIALYETDVYIYFNLYLLDEVIGFVRKLFLMFICYMCGVRNDMICVMFGCMRYCDCCLFFSYYTAFMNGTTQYWILKNPNKIQNCVVLSM